MSQIAGIDLHFDLSFDDIDKKETELYVTSIVEKYANLIFNQNLHIHTEVYEGSVKARIVLIGAIYMAIGQYGSFRSGIDYMIEDSKSLKGLIVRQLIKNGLLEVNLISAKRIQCSVDKIRRVLQSIDRLESKKGITKEQTQKELSKIKTSVKNICKDLDERDVGLFASSIDSKYIPENTPIPQIAAQYKVNAREEDITFSPLSKVQKSKLLTGLPLNLKQLNYILDRKTVQLSDRYTTDKINKPEILLEPNASKTNSKIGKNTNYDKD